MYIRAMSLLSVAAAALYCRRNDGRIRSASFFFFIARSYTDYLGCSLKFAPVPVFRSLTLAVIEIRKAHPLAVVEPPFKDTPLRSRRLRMINTYRKIFRRCARVLSAVFLLLKSARERYGNERSDCRARFS